MMGFSPHDFIRAVQRDVTDSFGRVGRAGERLGEGYETVAEARARLNADTPENNRRNAICDAAVAQIERAFGRRS